jgi:hypothetical protein
MTVGTYNQAQGLHASRQAASGAAAPRQKDSKKEMAPGRLERVVVVQAAGKEPGGGIGGNVSLDFRIVPNHM